MKYKVGVYIRENILDIISGLTAEAFNVKEVSSFDLKIVNFYNNLSIDDEKNLELNNVLIQKTLSSSKLAEHEANIIIPDEQCSLQIIKLPLVSEKEIISAIELQSEEFVPYPIEKASFDYQVLSIDKQANAMFLLLVVALKENIDKVSDYVLNLGLYPNGLESESTALFRLILNHHLKTDSKIVMLINIGNRASQVSILNTESQQLIATNSISIGSQFFYKALQNNLNIPLKSAIEIFSSIKQTDLHYQKIIKPVFAEYAKQIQKILMAALEKMGTLPNSVFLYTPRALSAYTLLFKDEPMLQQYRVNPLNLLPLNPTTIKLANEIKDKIGNYLIPLGAII